MKILFSPSIFTVDSIYQKTKISLDIESESAAIYTFGKAETYFFSSNCSNFSRVNLDENQWLDEESQEPTTNFLKKKQIHII